MAHWLAPQKCIHRKTSTRLAIYVVQRREAHRDLFPYSWRWACDCGNVGHWTWQADSVAELGALKHLERMHDITDPCLTAYRETGEWVL